MITFCYTIYNPKQETIWKHFNNWHLCSKELLKKFRVVFVDDCSDKKVIAYPDFHMNFTIARITDNIYWNLTGARNLAFHLADNDWCITTDMDHFFDPIDIQKIIEYNKERKNVYYFERYRNSKPCRTHLDSFLIHKQDMMDMGGYDEDMRGCRGANEDLITAIIDYSGFTRKQTDIKIYNDEFHGKVGGPRREMVQPNYVKLRNKKLLMKRNLYSPTENLRFNWEIVNEYTYPK